MFKEEEKYPLLQVIKDIIESHMEDIVASGGIGCAGRKPQDVPPARESSGRGLLCLNFHIVVYVDMCFVMLLHSESSFLCVFSRTFK